MECGATGLGWSMRINLAEHRPSLRGEVVFVCSTCRIFMLARDTGRVPTRQPEVRSADPVPRQWRTRAAQLVGIVTRLHPDQYECCASMLRGAFTAANEQSEQEWQRRVDELAELDLCLFGPLRGL